MGHLNQLEQLFLHWKKRLPERIEPLVNNSASPRKYFRVFDSQSTCIGAYNDDTAENKAFVYYTSVFSEANIPVPKLFVVKGNYSLQEDLGDENLLHRLKKEGETEETQALYVQSLTQLLQMQLYGGQKLDFENYAYPRAAFDAQSILWDLNYFKYYFLKMSGLAFNEQKLENDFQVLAQTLSKPRWSAFMFRDFQARNIQLVNNKVRFIDYQGGRRGPILYDLASLLNQASAQLSDSFKETLKTEYKKALALHYAVDDSFFEQEYYAMVFIRIVQTLGAYGYRGLIEGKTYFKESIPLALTNMEKLIESEYFLLPVPYFVHILKQLTLLKSKF